MYQGMVAFNPAPYTRAHYDPYHVINELVVAGAYLKVQPNLHGMTPKQIMQAVHRSADPRKPRRDLRDRKIGDLHSSMLSEIQEHIDEGFRRTTVSINEDTMPELEYIAAKHADLLEYMVGVWGLTSQNNSVIKKYHGVSRKKLMKRRVKFALEIGIRELVCGIPEVSAIRNAFPQYKINQFYTPGTRLPEDPVNDQEVVGTPEEAHGVGAIWIAGRPIINHSTPGVRYKEYAGIQNAATP